MNEKAARNQSGAAFLFRRIEWGSHFSMKVIATEKWGSFFSSLFRGTTFHVKVEPLKQKTPLIN